MANAGTVTQHESIYEERRNEHCSTYSTFYIPKTYHKHANAPSFNNCFGASRAYLVCFQHQDGLCCILVPDENVATVRAGDDKLGAPPRSLFYHRPVE